jgi:outer membrane protein assembly factor BamB
MRGDHRNTGRSPLLQAGTRPQQAPAVVMRRWHTGNGVFSTPVIGADETVYVGSADKHFYALDPLSGKERWRFATRECIDSAGCIAADGTVYFASCDASLYGLSASGEQRWRLNLFENRTHFTPSTIYWWEGNVVLGPTGWLYAGNDDFNMYAIESGKGVRWAYLTGLHIWAAPAFGDDGAVYVLSFDRNCYALDARTGNVRWRTNTGNFVVSSPAIGPDGSIHFGSFDGHVYALDARSGRIRWRLPTGGPIYATAAIAADGTLYIGSSDGCLYAIDTQSARVLWSFYTGDAIRGSAALGPDPSGEHAYLIYFGGGNGSIYALDPDGRRRWSLNTQAEAHPLDSPNINASIALGRWGLATASANGNVFYVPYDYYLSREEDPALDRRPGDGYPESGTFLYPMTPGGSMADQPLQHGRRPEPVDPSQTLSFRLLHRKDGRTQAAGIDPESITVDMDPPRPFRVTLQPNRAQINVIPDASPLSEEAGSLAVRARAVTAGAEAQVEGTFSFQPVPAADAPSAAALPGLPFRITHMSIYDPSIVPSFDQIGIASLTIRVRIVHVDVDSGAVVAWGVKKFGMDDDGNAVQVAIPRHLFYAFGGTYRAGRMVLSARHCNFELTAFPVPLDFLRFSGTWQGREGPGSGASMVAELDVPARFRVFSRTGRAPDQPQRLSRVQATAIPWSDVRAFVRRWLPDFRSAARSLPSILRALLRAVPLALQLLRRKTYGPWGLIGEDGWFRGVGTFRTAADEPVDTTAIDVDRFEHDPDGGRIVAEITAKGAATASLAGRVPGILVVDCRTNEPLPLRHDSATRVTRQAGRVRVELVLPGSPPPGPGAWKAYLLVDVTALAELWL